MSVIAEAAPPVQQLNLGIGAQAGRDLHIGVLNLGGDGRPKSTYEDLDLKELGQEIGSIPQGAVELANALEEGHLLVIEPLDLDAEAIARQVAWSLGDRLAGSDKVDQPIKIREWNHGSGPIDLKALLEGEGTKILLLARGEPKDFAGSFWELKNRLVCHFAIITTEHSRSEWHVPEGSDQEKNFWRRPDWEGYFGSKFLEQQLNKDLKLKFPVPADESSAAHEDRPAGGDHPALAGISAPEVVRTLRDPRRIQAFVEALQSLPQPASPESIHEKLAEASGDLQQAGLWYRAQRERDQLLAVGLILFGGLPADQVFAGLETLVEEVWRLADPLLPHFDYLDVERLSRYFQRIQRGGEGYFWIGDEQRRQVLEVAWQLHRRRILESMPAIAEMVRNAAVFLDNLHVDAEDVKGTRQQPPPADANRQQRQEPAPASGSDQHDRKLLWQMGRTRELYGTVRRMAGLQAATVDSLSQLGGLSAAAFDAIEPCFRELAANESGAVRTVVAGALVEALRKMSGPDDRPLLLAKLVEWWREGCQSPEGLSQGRRSELVATRATVALAVGLAAGNCPPNQMAQELVDLLSRLVEDQFLPVRTALRGEVLYRAVARHLRQLEELVRTKIAAQADLVPAAAAGVAEAYWWSPGETMTVLEGWCDRALAPATAPTGTGVGAETEALLSLLARSLGYMVTEEADPAFPPARIFRELRAILAASRRPGVRRQVLVAAGQQALRNYDLAAPLLSELLVEITLEERSILVELFTRAYLDQRQQLSGGEETIQVGGVFFPAWIRQPRPPSRLTKVEQALFFWLQVWDRPVAQQVAAESFAALAGTALDRRERELTAEGRNRGVPVAAAPSFDPAIRPVLLRSLGPLGWLALAAVIRGRELRAALWAPFAELLWIRRLPPAGASSAAAAGSSGRWPSGLRMASAEEVLQRWRTGAANDSLRSLVDYLQRALEIYRWRWVAVGFSGAAMWLAALWLAR